MTTQVPLGRPDPEHQRIYERIKTLEVRMLKIEDELAKHREAIAYIRTCYLTPNVKRELDKLVGPEIKGKSGDTQ